MVSVSENAAYRDVAVPSRAWTWRGPRYVAEVFDGPDEALAALESVQRGLKCTGFQSLNWLTVLYEELAPSKRAMPRVVIVTERNSGEVAIVLPLIVIKKRTLTVARSADLGVSDYGGPMLGLAPLKKRRSIRRVWRVIRHALKDVDLRRRSTSAPSPRRRPWSPTSPRRRRRARPRSPSWCRATRCGATASSR